MLKPHKKALMIKMVEGLFYSLVNATTSKKLWQHRNNVLHE